MYKLSLGAKTSTLAGFMFQVTVVMPTASVEFVVNSIVSLVLRTKCHISRVLLSTCHMTSISSGLLSALSFFCVADFM